MDDKNINDEVRDYQLQKAKTWPLQPVSELAWHYYVELCTACFPEDKLPPCYFHCGPANRKSSSRYRSGHNDIGTFNDFGLNSKLLNRPRIEIARDVAHGLVHVWQYLHGSPSRSGRHNVEFTRMAKAVGVPYGGERCCKVIYHTDEFTSIVAKIDPYYMDICMEDEATEPTKPADKAENAGVKKRIKYACLCRKFRTAPDWHAKCLDCNTEYEPYL